MTGQSVKFKKHIKTIKKRSPVRVSQLRNKIFFEKCQRPTEKVQSLSISNAEALTTVLQNWVEVEEK